MFEWTYSGVNLSLEGTGGVPCVKYLQFSQIVNETLVISIISIIYIAWSWQRIKLPYNLCYRASHGNARRLLLLLHGVTFGVEIGFKCATNSLIWVLNPCHMITILQLIILTAPCTPLTTGLFRLQVHMINGPLLALIFPVVNTRLLQFEQLVYYVQHILIVVVPMYLMKSEGMFSVEPLKDMSYAVMSLGLQTLYHFWVLQYISYKTLINLDNILCPAISDPFNGINYRKYAVAHQTILILIHGKILTVLADLLIFRFYSYDENNKDDIELIKKEVMPEVKNADNDLINSQKVVDSPIKQEAMKCTINELLDSTKGDYVDIPSDKGLHNQAISNNNLHSNSMYDYDPSIIISVSNPDEAYAYNYMEQKIKDHNILDLFLDQSDTIRTRSCTYTRSNSVRSDDKTLTDTINTSCPNIEFTVDSHTAKKME